MRFTASDTAKGILTNEAAKVKDIDAQIGQLTLIKVNGDTVLLDGKQALNLNYNYAKTTFTSQGQTADRVLYHAQSISTNLMNQRDFYVGLSRATTEINVMTDSKRDLSNLIEKSTGEKLTALENDNFSSLTQYRETSTQIEADLEQKSFPDSDNRDYLSEYSVPKSADLSEKSAELERD